MNKNELHPNIVKNKLGTMLSNVEEDLKGLELNMSIYRNVLETNIEKTIGDNPISEDEELQAKHIERRVSLLSSYKFWESRYKDIFNVTSDAAKGILNSEFADKVMITEKFTGFQSAYIHFKEAGIKLNDETNVIGAYFCNAIDGMLLLTFVTEKEGDSEFSEQDYLRGNETCTVMLGGLDDMTISDAVTDWLNDIKEFQDDPLMFSNGWDKILSDCVSLAAGAIILAETEGIHAEGLFTEGADPILVADIDYGSLGLDVSTPNSKSWKNAYKTLTEAQDKLLEQGHHCFINISDIDERILFKEIN